MTPTALKPLHRSLRFWLGLPGLVFILWSWHDSLTHQAGISRSHWFPTTRSTMIIFDDSIAHYHSTLRIQKLLFEPGIEGKVITYSPRLAKRSISGLRREGWQAIFPAPANETVSPPFWDAAQVRLKHILIPHWLILLLYSAAWIGIMTWLGRRVKRLKQAATPDPSPGTKAA